MPIKQPTREIKMPTNPLVELGAYGQSVWYDNIRRGLIASGELQRMIAQDNVTGVTSNPSIFEKAIADSDDYGDTIASLVTQGASAEEIYEALAFEDIAATADLLRPVYECTQGDDGYVSIEVSPRLAHDTQGSIAQARRIFAALERPNVMIKVPATPAGLPAISALIAGGVNVNVTLIFALERYEQVAEAYLSGLEQRVARGQSLGKVASVASFFVSRIDTLVDQWLEHSGHATPALLGKTAVASAKLVYEKYQTIFEGDRFAALKAQGARVQRPLWGSTSTKNPAYSDVLYVEELIGPNTVNTIPHHTLEAFRDHGRVGPTLTQDVGAAHAVFEQLAVLGLDVTQVTEKLLAQGVAAFGKSFDSLMASIEDQRSAML
jgi:transaldolase